MYSSTGFVLVDGTSFSTPLVAGAAALLRGARPGLSVDQYRSLLINSAAALPQAAGVDQSGAGVLDALAALQSTVTSYPTSLSFGAGGPDPGMTRNLTLTNLGASNETFSMAASGTLLTPDGVELVSGASMDVPITLNAAGLAPGPYQGFITVTAASSGASIRIPYWYAVRSTGPARITILDLLSSARRSSTQSDAIMFRVTDASGLPITDRQPDVTSVSGGGSVRSIHSYDSDVPGLFGVDVQLGLTAGVNVFRIQAGAQTIDVSITGQ
jgi:hypothetical protein